MQIIIKVSFLLAFGISTAQTNLLDTSTWTTGNGSLPGFIAYGSNVKNHRMFGDSPYGVQVVLWVGTPDGTSSTVDGGFSTTDIAIDHDKTYRFTVWMKKVNSFDGSEVFKTIGLTNSILKLDGNNSSNPIFVAGGIPNLDKWYLYVGFVHKSSYMGTIGLGGIYDGTTGLKVSESSDYKFSSSEEAVRLIANLYASGNASDSILIYAPSIYEVNGMEPSLEELINPNTGSEGTSVWNSSNSGIEYSLGNVGIGTEAQLTYKLAVNGKIHAKEVKVDLDGWADYVFREDYNLPTLEEVEQHIRENGHLVNVPSAADVVNNGIELGEMNKILLEKIEELTLYILEQDKLQKQLMERINLLEKTK